MVEEFHHLLIRFFKFGHFTLYYFKHYYVANLGMYTN